MARSFVGYAAATFACFIILINCIELSSMRKGKRTDVRRNEWMNERMRAQAMNGAALSAIFGNGRSKIVSHTQQAAGS